MFASKAVLGVLVQSLCVLVQAAASTTAAEDLWLSHGCRGSRFLICSAAPCAAAAATCRCCRLAALAARSARCAPVPRLERAIGRAPAPLQVGHRGRTVLNSTLVASSITPSSPVAPAQYAHRSSSHHAQMLSRTKAEYQRPPQVLAVAI